MRARLASASRVLRVLAAGVALAVVWFALVAPDRWGAWSVGTFVRLPLELVVLVSLAWLLPLRWWTVLAVPVGTVVGLVAVLKVLDVGFYEVLDRPFDLLVDWGYLGAAIGVVEDSLGSATAVGLTLLAVLAATVVVVFVPLALVRGGQLVREHRHGVGRGLVVAWAAIPALALSGLPATTASASTYVYDEIAGIPAGLADQREFARAARDDPLAAAGDDLFGALRGKDVLLVFVESYGRAALEDSAMAPGVGAVLDRQAAQLEANGFSGRSAFLTSPTFGAGSWLAHASMQSGLWVDSQRRYDVLVTGSRLTLSDLFGRAGWRTVAVVPANTHDWPQGAFYDYARVYDSRDLGYGGPRFGYATMPDQYTLEAFGRRELTGSARPPVFAEIDLISSHAPWAPLPRMVPWQEVGDGSVFAEMPEQGRSRASTWRDASTVRAAYGESIEYALTALYSWVRRTADDDTVLVVLGDHQPATIVSGRDPGRDVPVSVVARDPAVLRALDGWGWQAGLHPDPDAPVWRMDAFRDRFVAAYSPSRELSRGEGR